TDDAEPTLRVEDRLQRALLLVREHKRSDEENVFEPACCLAEPAGSIEHHGEVTTRGCDHFAEDAMVRQIREDRRTAGRGEDGFLDQRGPYQRFDQRVFRGAAVALPLIRLRQRVRLALERIRRQRDFAPLVSAVETYPVDIGTAHVKLAEALE